MIEYLIEVGDIWIVIKFKNILIQLNSRMNKFIGGLFVLFYKWLIIYV